MSKTQQLTINDTKRFHHYNINHLERELIDIPCYCCFTPDSQCTPEHIKHDCAKLQAWLIANGGN